MRVAVVIPAEDVQAGDKLLIELDAEDVRLAVVREVFNTGHERVQVTLDEPRWFDSTMQVVVFRETA